MTMTRLLMLCLLLAMAGCGQAQPELKTFDQVVLLDVQGLWGGRDLWISSHGQAIYREAGHSATGAYGMEETRYEFELSPEQQIALLSILNQHDFFSIKTKSRYGVPDEARPNIYVKADVRSHATAKWSGDKHRDFDAIYEFLLNIAATGKSGKAIYTGEYDWDWSPDGYTATKAIREMTKLHLDEK